MNQALPVWAGIIGLMLWQTWQPERRHIFWEVDMHTTNGGPAFPVVGQAHGMTLRDAMAIAAMNGELSAGVLPTSDYEIRAHAVMYYKIADAMLEERNKV
jgi:hypothetical protein